MRQTVGLFVTGLFMGLALGWAIYAASGCSGLQPAEILYENLSAPWAPITVYFSPSDGPERAILSSLNNAKNSVHVALYQLTDPEIAQALLETFRRGLEVQILLDDEPSRGSKGCLLLSAGIPVKEFADSGIMHHKFAVIDGAKLINGSYNWTTSAQTRNEENLLVIESAELSQIFAREFQRLWTHKRARLLDNANCS